jgi:hypothetical protein
VGCGGASLRGRFVFVLLGEPSSFAPPAAPTILSPEALADYVGGIVTETGEPERWIG